MIAYIGIGSNMGNRELNLQKAEQELSILPNTKLLRSSKIIETKPYGYKYQSDFLNQVIELETELDEMMLLHHCHKIEKILKRERSRKWGPRTVDLDILFYGKKVIINEEIKIPHPELHKRLFVLESLNELIPEMIHPRLGLSINEIYKIIKAGKVI